jgi:sRNA-binding carbon storage regulator CsrA
VLVLRRRPNEAIVFDGGLTLRLVAVSGRAVWLGLTDPSVAHEVELSLPASSGESAELAVRRPRSLERVGSTTTIELCGDGEDPDAVLTLSRKPGEVLAIGAMRIELAAIEEEHAYLELSAPSLPSAVRLSIVTVSTVDARIGVDAPSELRVYRKEVWDEMQAANTAAAGEWTDEDLAALSTKTP